MTPAIGDKPHLNPYQDPLGPLQKQALIGEYVYIYIYIYILESRARFARAQFSYLDVEARRPCWEVVRSRSVTPTPFAGYTFLYTSASGNKEHTEHLPQCLEARIPCLLKHKRSDAKYCMTVDMANTTIDGASELEVGKNSNLAFG